MRRNFTIDDISPLISYIPFTQWRDGTGEDPLLDRYSNGGTFRLTTEKDAKASFTFVGTGVWIFGAKRGNHGPYTSNIDGVGTLTEDGFAVDPGLFQTPLVSRPNLVAGLHTVEIINSRVDSSKPFLDVDAITWETEIPDEASTTVIIEDTHKSLEYLPSPQVWKSNSCTDLQSYSGGTCHESLDPTASVKLTFQGEVVTVYGGVGPGHGPYIATIDSQAPMRFSALANSPRGKQVIFHAANLGSGSHTLTLSPNPSRTGEVFDIDYIEIIGASADPTAVSATVSQTVSNPAGTNLIGAGEVNTPMTSTSSQTIGIVAGIASGVILVAVITFILWYRKRHPHFAFSFLRRNQRAEEDIMSENRFGFSSATHSRRPSEITPYTNDSSRITLHTRDSSAMGEGTERATTYSGGTSSDLQNFHFPPVMVIANTPNAEGPQHHNLSISTIPSTDSAIVFRQPSSSSPSSINPSTTVTYGLNGDSSIQLVPPAGAKSQYIGSIQRSRAAFGPGRSLETGGTFSDPPPLYTQGL